jgi:hypothetical protein
MFELLENVVLNEDLIEYKLDKGDIGTIVHVYENGNTYEVEFTTGDGHSVAVLTLSESNLRSMNGLEILHAREIDALA